MKRQQITMIACGVLMAAVCGVAGWFLYSETAIKNEAAEERDRAYQELQQIYRAKVFPSDENIARVGEDQKVLEGWLATASNQLHKGDLHVEPKTPTSFKQELQASVRRLSAHSGAVQGKIVGPNFYFGFDQYLGQSDSLPASEHVDRLAVQLAIIEKICEELYAANILELKKVEREVFDIVRKEEEPQETSPRRRGRRRDDSGGSARASGSAARAETAYWTSQRFTVEFVARPAAFIEALNRLAAMDLFAVVAEVELRKTGDLLAQFNARKKESSAKLATDGAAPVDPAKLSHVERIVTDPELEPPVNVKLDIDVYSFEGV
ncbi:MAG TPA: Amuc_1100 family pilus-like protein [Kiritimatiellia bacterium]|nr:Amuc_1100 family pilus-like protein [Kiritimatiellia bacterium]